MRYLVVFFVLISFAGSISASWYPDRRRDQFPKEDAYLVVPLPYSYPGIGEGFFLLGSASNLFDTTADAVFVEITGDASGRVGFFDEVPLLVDELFLSIQVSDINRAAVNQYAIRGMEDSDADDYTILDIGEASGSIFRLDYTLDNRRFNYFFSRSVSESSLNAVRDPDGNLIQQLDSSFSTQSTSNLLGFSIDLTDDYLDPRKGFRFGMDYIDHANEDELNDPDFYVINYNFLYYLPFRKADTLVFNYFQSDAHVRAIGNVNEADIRNELGLNCGANIDCLQTEQRLVNNLVSARTYGSALTLGGLERLRSYPQDRFSGAHSAFLGAEYRWNLAEEAMPFNYFFWKDVRTGRQIAFFVEAGSVSEVSSDLWGEQRYTYGVGFRLLAASGSVYRVDIASGDEGMEVAVFFYYPWK